MTKVYYPHDDIAAIALSHCIEIVYRSNPKLIYGVFGYQKIRYSQSLNLAKTSRKKKSPIKHNPDLLSVPNSDQTTLSSTNTVESHMKKTAAWSDRLYKILFADFVIVLARKCPFSKKN
jgi:hypothetical protein